jgi:hypothetical protein
LSWKRGRGQGWTWFFSHQFPPQGTDIGGFGGRRELRGRDGADVDLFVPNFATRHPRRGLAVILTWKVERGQGGTCLALISPQGVLGVLLPPCLYGVHGAGGMTYVKSRRLA